MEKLILDKKISQETKADMESIVRQVDNMNDKEMHEVITKYKLKSPITNNDLSEPVAFNLMFSTSIGPTGTIKGYNFINLKNLIFF